MPPNILLFGATSILGFSLARQFSVTVLPFVTRANRARSIRQWPVLNLEDPLWAESIFKNHQPDLLLYCHAVCDVPRCEAAPDWAHEVNISYLDRVIAVLPTHTRLVYVSSDHVFGGDGTYDEESVPCPISVYGRTRVSAEELVLNRAGSLIVRVGLPIGPSPNGRTGHWDWLRYRMRRNLPITIVHDEYRSVVWADELATRVMQLAESSEIGIRHVSATRAVSRIELANHLLAIFGEPATYERESRHQRAAPHIGRVELASCYRGELFEPLTSVLDGAGRAGDLFLK
jgi:dTDP-4-dehydrorhamnose reductase